MAQAERQGDTVGAENDDVPAEEQEHKEGEEAEAEMEDEGEDAYEGDVYEEEAEEGDDGEQDDANVAAHTPRPDEADPVREKREKVKETYGERCRPRWRVS